MQLAVTRRDDAGSEDDHVARPTHDWFERSIVAAAARGRTPTDFCKVLVRCVASELALRNATVAIILRWIHCCW
jgi:hypothetical protein